MEPDPLGGLKGKDVMERNEKKIHLIEIAEKLFSKNGYTSTSIRDIAREASVNSAMISYYFGSKEKLVQAIFVYRTTDLSILFTEIKTKQDNPVISILSLVNFYVDKVFEQSNFYRLLFQIQAVEKEHVLLEYFNNIRFANYQVIQKYFLEGRSSGVFRQDIDVSFFTSTVVGTINHIFFNQEQYKKVNNLQLLSEKEFVVLLKEKIKSHIEKIVASLIL